ncbi:hypothetical protein ACLECU_15010 [Lonsdalea quercina]|uniref:hypothetical protein n=1 Tax=Lonsdalea quercina TaxID=71657 RepID=UPI0039768663
MNSKKSAGLPVDKLSVRVSGKSHCGDGEEKTTTLALKECTIKEQWHSSGAENRLIAERYRHAFSMTAWPPSWVIQRITEVPGH